MRRFFCGRPLDIDLVDKQRNAHFTFVFLLIPTSYRVDTTLNYLNF